MDRVEGILFPGKDSPGIRLDVKIPPGLLESAEAKMQQLWWAGFASGMGWGVVLGLGIAALMFILWRRNQ